MKWDEDIDASGDALLSADEAVAFEAENHLMDRGREVALHVSLGRGLVEHARIYVDEGQILALLFGEAMRAGAARGA
jgi:hypothetical protein